MLSDVDVDLSAVWSTAMVRQLRERLSAADGRGPDSTLDELERVLLEQRLQRTMHPAVN